MHNPDFSPKETDFMDSEQQAFMRDTDPVFRHVMDLATATPKGVKIGSQFTGRREFLWDSRAGVYSESLPLVSYDEWLVQQALCPPQPAKPRPRIEPKKDRSKAYSVLLAIAAWGLVGAGWCTYRSLT